MPSPGKVPFAAPKYVQTHSGWLNPMGMRGMVTTPHYLASQTAVSILQRGGNAVDAAAKFSRDRFVIDLEHFEPV
jgi:gamma-glutamyltranspeptidase